MGTGREDTGAESASRVARGETEPLRPLEAARPDAAPRAEAVTPTRGGAAWPDPDGVASTPDRDVFSDPQSSRRVLRVGSVLAGGRLRVLRRLGQGGMGVVYEAYDHERQARVALKTLSVADPRGIYQFKNEFRALCRIHHPGLVRLHHLYAENDAWFFTMDLIEGERFDRWVRPGGKLDEPRLRAALRKLVQALAAIHDAGKLHRDVKSSNVLVTAEGRVVVLDLGLVADHFRGGAGQTVSDWVLAGTPEYMAPEQAAGQLTTCASDLYGVGVMLFEALTGQLPFQGSLAGILFGKQREPPSFPALDVCDGPSDLIALCRGLLSRDPRARPTAAEMLEGACRSLVPEPATPLLAPPSPSGRTRLVGRADELAVLWRAFGDASAGVPVVMLVSGESGIGKTELVGSFLADLRARRGAVVLAGRCYEREGVPFKAIDPLVDELSRYFRIQSREDARALLPRDVDALAQLFPVLARVDVIAEAPARTAADPYELSRRGFAAFAELLGRLRDREPLVLHIDDMHWADMDSALLLRHVLVDRGVAPLLLLLSHHSECATSEVLEPLLGAVRSNPACSLRQLAVPPLSSHDAERLARELLGDAAQALSASIARESRGSPFFVWELSRLAPAAPVCPSLSEAMAARVALLPVSARRLLEVTALVGQPLGARAALEASHGSQADLDALDDARLVRQSESHGVELVECYHDRIREAVASGIGDAAARGYHAALAAALTREEQADPELVSRCCEGAGEPLAAARYAVLAAERASLTMAFDHAAELYQKALELGLARGTEPRDVEIELLCRLARALENAGRGAEAAAVYRRAAERVAGERRLELSRHAAEQLLATGRIDEGARLLREVCRALGVHFPTSPGSALLSLAWTGVRLRSRGLAAPALPSASARDGLRLRTAHTLVTGLVGYLPAHVASVAGKYLLLALDSGDVTERVRSLGFNAYIYSLFDPRSARTNELLWRMQELADASGRAELLGFASMIRGTTAYHLDRYAEARESCGRALAALRGSPGMNWEIDAASIYDQLSAMARGDYADIARVTPGLVDEALRRGRVWTGAMLSGIAGMPAWLTNGDMASYRRQLAEVARHWTPRARPHWPDFLLLVGDALASIYEGRPQHGFELFEARARVYGRHMLARGGGTGSIAYAIYHARCAAAVLGATKGSSQQRAPRAARALRRSLASLSHYTTPKASASAQMLRAALVLADGEQEACARSLAEAASGFERAGMHMFVAACRRRLGQLLGGAQGRELIARGDRFMLAQGVVDLESETEMDCPGCRS